MFLCVLMVVGAALMLVACAGGTTPTSGSVVIVVDASLVPPIAALPPLGGRPRPLAVLEDADGTRAAFVADELWVATDDRASLDALAGKYEMINIKLDKTGGLTEALALRAEAEARGFSVMVGCMIGSSLAMAPAHLVAQGAAITDLDAPLLLAEDRSPAMAYDGSGIHPPEPALWG